MTTLPSTGELKKLTLRALAAYAASCARRGSGALHGVLEEEIIESPLRIAERVASSATPIPRVSIAILDAALGVTRIFSAVPPGKKRAGLCLVALSSVIVGIHEAGRNLVDTNSPGFARRMYLRSIRSAVNIAKWAVPIDGPTEEAVHAARHDYEVLVQAYGKHEEVVLGEPVDVPGLRAQG